MKTRFFYAARTFNTWPKLFVLSEDGTLYCEYLDYMKPATIHKQVDFYNFKAKDYSFEGYQSLQEIDEDIALSKTLTRQSNWVAQYLRRIRD